MSNYCKKCYELTEQLDQLKAENDLFRTCHDNEQAKRRKYGQAIEAIKEKAYLPSDYTFIEGNELRLTLTEDVN